MRARVVFVLVVAITAIAPLRTAISHEIEPTLTIQYTGAPLVPGSVGVLVARSAAAVSTVQGRVFDRPVRFWPVGAGQWHALVGVGLETAAGSYPVVVHATAADGSPLVAESRVDVAPKEFETRRLRVAQRFVEPPAAEAERIQNDARLLARVFRTKTDRTWRGPFVAPVGGPATSSFGRLTLLNGRPNGRHQGADFRAATGTTVVAPNAGRVALASDLYFAGKTVIVDHGLGLFSLLAHLSAIDVSVGDLVARSDAVGRAGATGRVTGPHVHWAVRLESLSVDPLALLEATADLPEPDYLLSTP